MVLAEYKPTRSQLLQLRRTRRTAERGHRLLKLKRDALIVEFFRVLERTMRRLIEEIEKVKRRVKALEYRVIPELKSTEAFIRQRLEEMERDNFMRLKRFKAT